MPLPLAAIPEVVFQAGHGAAALAALGLLVLGPLVYVQRRDVERMTRWQELEPDRGDAAAPLGPADTGGHPAVAAASATETRPPTDPGMSPAQRVTSDRPALERITMERAALASPSLLVRLRAGLGPRHPLAFLLGGGLVAAGLIAAVLLVVIPLSEDEGDGKRGPFDPAEVGVAVFNASGVQGVGTRFAAELEGAGFDLIRNGALDPARQTAVLYAQGSKKAGKELGKELEITVLQPISAEIVRQAPDADVVVILGEDQARP